MPKRPRRKYTKRRKTYKKGYKKPSKSFKKKVQAIINRNAENKEGFRQFGTTAFNSGITTGGDIIQVMPNIGNNSTDFARIGDQIMAKRLTIKGCVVWNPVAANFGSYTSSRIYVRLMVVSPKQYPNVNDAIANTAWLNTLLKKGGTTTSFSGAINDLWAPINTDAVTKYYDKVMPLTAFYSPANSSVQMLGSTKFFSKTFRYKGAGKLLKYDASIASGLTPTNYGPVLLLGYCYADGSAPTTLTTDITMQFDAVFQYQDM